jgi:serine/threonine-protein kinase SRPK3
MSKDSSSSNSSLSSPSNGSDSSYIDKSLGEEFARTILKNKYILIDKIGYGTFSGVWLAVDIDNLNLYAIKIQHIDDYYDGEKEATFLTNIPKKCVNLPKLVEHFDTKNPLNPVYMNLCMVMDLYIGSVDNLINKGGFTNGFDVKICNKIILDVLNGLETLNNMGYMHTDIKPENVLIKGLNPIYEEFNNAIKESDKVKELIKQINNKFNEYKLHLLDKKTKIYVDRKRKFNTDKTSICKKISNELINMFKKICNKYCLEKYIDDNENIFVPNYYLKKFDFKDKIKDNLLNYTYVLSDFGTIKHIGQEHNSEIQTRYYRAPEVIFGCYWNKSVDIWSIGCLYFECLTGDLLFDPKNDEEHDTDAVHLYWISQLIELDMEQYKNGIYFTRTRTQLKYKRKIKWSELFIDYNIDLDDNTIMIMELTIANPKDRNSINQIKLLL